VFRQPRDRELIDVFDDVMTHVKALFDGKQRQTLREQRRARKLARRSGGVTLGSLPAGAAPSSVAGNARAAGPYSGRIRQAAADRDEIGRLMDLMPSSERARLAEVTRSASALFERIQGLAVSLNELDRSLAPGAVETIEAEITRLESAANPLDRAASEDRVRRLAYLRRQRRAMVDLAQRHESVAGKLETCAVALQNMRLDMMRLRMGDQTHQNITTLANNALSLADSVDNALYVADEMGRIGQRPSARSSAGP
jgi:serine/threonine-protein kinase